MMDDLLARSYNIAAHWAYPGTVSVPAAGWRRPHCSDPNDASLQALAFMSRELGILMSSVTLACCQVWLAQSPLSEGCCRTLWSLPVVPGQIYGPDICLIYSLWANQAMHQFASLQQGMWPDMRKKTSLSSSATYSHLPARTGGQPWASRQSTL